MDLSFQPISDGDIGPLLRLIPAIDADPRVIGWTRDQLLKCVRYGPSTQSGFGEHHFSNFTRTVFRNGRIVGCFACTLVPPNWLDEVREVRTKQHWYKVALEPGQADESIGSHSDLLLTSCFWESGSQGVPDLAFLEATLSRLTRFFEGHRINRVAATVTSQFVPVIQVLKYVIPADDCSISPLTDNLHLLIVRGPWKGHGLFGDWGKRLLRPHTPCSEKDLLTLQQRRVARVLHEFNFNYVEATKCGALPTWSFKETSTGRMQDSVTGYWAWSSEVTARLNIKPGKRRSKLEGLQAYFAENPSAMIP
jgi:hypothetical protein